MKLAIMQPYFFPYIGYFQLINTADAFVIYDNIQYTKKGWVNRNRILVNGKDDYITLPVKKDSDYLNIVERKLADSFADDKIKMLRRITESYRKAPEFGNVFPVIEAAINSSSENLFEYIYQSLQQVCNFLNIKTPFIVSSTVPANHQLKSQEKVIAYCQVLGAAEYINPIGGVELYSKEAFHQHNIKLSFLKSTEIVYPQYKNEFIPWLSIIDVMMFNSREKIQQYLAASYTII